MCLATGFTRLIGSRWDGIRRACAGTKDKQVRVRKRFYNRETETIRGFFAELGEFEMVCEATGSYEWLFRLLSLWLPAPCWRRLPTGLPAR